MPRVQAAAVVERRGQQRLADALALAARQHGVRREAPQRLAAERRRHAHHPGLVLGDPAATRVGAHEVPGALDPDGAVRARSAARAPGRDGSLHPGVELEEALVADPLGRGHVLGAHRPDHRAHRALT